MSTGGQVGGKASGAPRRVETEGKENIPYPSVEQGQARDHVAKAVGVSGKSMDDAGI